MESHGTGSLTVIFVDTDILRIGETRVQNTLVRYTQRIIHRSLPGAFPRGCITSFARWLSENRVLAIGNSIISCESVRICVQQICKGFQLIEGIFFFSFKEINDSRSYYIFI